MEQNKLSKGPLLNLKGYLNEAGYHTSLVKDYYRDMVKVRGMRIKEWDYYYVGNDHIGIALTVADNSYMWFSAVTLFDFDQKIERSFSKMGFFSNGKLKMPRTSSKGDVVFQKKGQSISFILEKNRRHIKADIASFYDKKPLLVDLILEPTIKDSMVIATPFSKKKHFYYNQKMNLLKASGSVSFGEEILTFKDAYGVLDWGRGVWTYKNTWYWSSMSGIYQGKKIGFNLGYGFGDLSKATENMLFYGDKTYKLNDVIFNIPQKEGKDDYLSPWTMSSSDGAIQLEFVPILDRFSHSNVLIIESRQHQVFGKFSGIFKVNDQEVIEIKNMIGFAEKVFNRWWIYIH
ncbi:MAG: DUF2804 domain-containing protein [Acholeplasma sp.]|nr:MAG: DUF2804 domain-containing protein [Acholeplasma sp.]